MAFSVDLLGAWYGARSARQMAGFAGAPKGAGEAGAKTDPKTGAKPKVLPPWDPRGSITALETLRRNVLGSGRFFDSALSNFARKDVSRDEKQLFALYEGLRGLQALADAAMQRNVNEFDRNFWQRRFDEGLSQLTGFFQDLDLEGVSVLRGKELSKAESELVVSRGLSQYQTKAFHSGPFDAEVAAFQGDVAFTITVRKNGADTDVAIDLSELGAQPRTLDAVVGLINQKLEDAEMLTRFERVRVGTPNERGVIEGNEWGFNIQGILTERISFSAPAAAPAVWLAGVSGTGDAAAGQLSRISGLDAGGSVDFTRRIEADAEITETTNDRGDTRTSQTANPLKILDTAQARDGGVYVVGHAASSVSGQALKGEQDLVLQRYDTTGKLVWTRTLGAAESASGASLAVDDAGNVVVAGSVKGGLSGTNALGGQDSLVVKFNADGVEQWVQRFGGQADDRALSVTTGADGTIYVAGETRSGFGGMAHQGMVDGYVRAIGSDGTTLYTRSVEAGAGIERVRAVAMAADGGLITASEVDGRAVLVKFAAGDDGTGEPVWRQDLGDLDGGRIAGLAVDEDGAIYLTGAAGAGFAPSDPLNPNAGGRDAMLVKLNDGPEPSVAYTTFLGGEGDTAATAMRVEDGKVYLAGTTTDALPGSEQSGERNSFAAGFDAATGALDWTRQISGRGGMSEATGIMVDRGGDTVLNTLGLPNGAVVYADSRVITERSSVRAGDHFFISVDGGRPRRIEIGPNETMRSLTFKLNAAMLFNGSADVRRSREGDGLRLTPRKGVTIELTPGADGRDALSALGLPSGSITGKGSPRERNKDATSDAPPVFALELPDLMSIRDRASAQAAYEALSEAQAKIQRAWRELTMDPALKEMLKGPANGKRGGTVPSYLTAQIANYQSGLDRLMGGGGGQTLGFF
ncbi:PQQ-like beta-propeller repeat protein [Alkalicaulis satelles]|uniref:PQQ-like beta-propeller repeat protein n=1 Tax=Alkalicaulis satelles TaxID=2609175 RepID=A0A5M6ZHT0_9PROT|nr:PQQ-binding-like beta-propeller repeat protein [Alkalicaulis satelles]KAA5803354.1 PQQ-like beta-propeller repeat protein [Alkalicaulis satelles]